MNNSKVDTKCPANIKKVYHKSKKDKTFYTKQLKQLKNGKTLLENLAKDSDINIRIYDSSGKLVRNLALGRKEAGIYTGKDKAIYWDLGSQRELSYRGCFLIVHLSPKKTGEKPKRIA